jgi:hypothetical protein
MDVLALRDNAKQQLEKIKDVETGIEYLNKVKGIEVWAKAEKKDAELQNMIAEQKIRTQRILGRLIKDGQKKGEIATKDNGYTGNQWGVPKENTPKTLSSIGISRKDSSTFQTIASISENVFENFIEEKKQKVNDAIMELTTSGIVAFAKGKPHVSNNSGENEWYTPEYIIKASRKTMGSIDLDPATSIKANEIVKAKRIFTKDDNGLIKKWDGNVWMNPPYSQPLINEFSAKIIDELKNINQACILVNNATETNWFQNILIKCDCICFLKSRVKFIDMNGNATGAPLQGQALIYFGNNHKKFFSNFCDLGICLTRIEDL